MDGSFSHQLKQMPFLTGATRSRLAGRLSSYVLKGVCTIAQAAQLGRLLGTLCGVSSWQSIRQYERSQSLNRSTKRRVLVIEDDLETAQILAVLLKDIGHQVEFAVTAAAGLESAGRFQPEVVILDLMLPDRDGCEVARLLKSDSSLPHLCILGVTGVGTEKLRRRALESGCDGCLDKPLDPASIQALLKEIQVPRPHSPQ